MSISPTESTRGSHPLAPHSSNTSPSPRHGTVRRSRRSSPRVSVSPPSAAALGTGESGSSSSSVVSVIVQSINPSQKVVGFRISGEENDPYTQEGGDVSEFQSSGQGSLGRLELPRGPRIYSPRRQRKIKPYNKDLFLQANFKFIVLDTGNYQIDSMDPDKMLQWEDIICVRYCSPSEVRCPICLESPLCPQITSCGHIYCFPCILRYLLMGKEDYRGECWKKCPLCFTMISAKQLNTIFVTQLQHFHVGDSVTFTLLGRSKNSLTPFIWNLSSEYSSADENPADVFSKFILTSDVELTVREAKLDLSKWLHRADLGLVDDLENLPYVSAALEQLEERMKYWCEYRSHSSSVPPKDSFSSVSSNKSKHFDNLRTSRLNSVQKLSPISDGGIITGISGLSVAPRSNLTNKGVPPKMEERCAATIESNEQNSYTFYQVFDGQHLILHPLNMKCLLNHFGCSDMLPPSVTGKILELETITQSEATRKRYRFLSHFSLTTTFQFCEIDLSDMLPPISLAPFMDEIKKRAKQRKQTAKKEERDRVKAEVAAAVQASAMRFEHRNFSQSHSDVMFSLDDFEALGNNAGPSTSPPASERKLFSDVTRLGFASAQDSPPLRAETGDTTGKNESTRDQGPASTSCLSFASILSSAGAAADSSAEMRTPNAIGKKGKKPTKVLLSTTAGGRRYRGK
ncbi:unnamed protein product [Alopecurus aequalis]